MANSPRNDSNAPATPTEGAAAPEDATAPVAYDVRARYSLAQSLTAEAPSAIPTLSLPFPVPPQGAGAPRRFRRDGGPM